MKQKFLFAALGAAALAAAALPFTAGADHRNWFGRGGGDGGRGGFFLSDRMVDKLSKRLELSKAQRDAVYAAADEARPALRAARDQWRESRRAMRELTPGESGYDAKAAELAKANAKHAEQATLHIAKFKAGVFAALNAEQTAQLQKMLDRRGKGYKRGHHKRGFWGGRHDRDDEEDDD